MLNLIGLEIKKLLFRKKTLITTIAFLLLIGLVAYGCIRDEENRIKWDNPQNQIENMQQSIDSLKAQMNDPNISEDSKKANSMVIAQMQDQINQLKADSGKNVDWKKDLQTTNDNLKQQLDQTIDSREKSDLKQQIQQNEYFINHNIAPEGNKLSGFSFLSTLFDAMGAIFLVVGVGLFTADMVSGECTPPTLKLLLAQPVSRRRVLLSKFIAVVSSAIVMIVTIEFISFIIMGLAYGFGNFNYPMFVGTKYQFDILSVENGVHPLISVAGSTYIITRGAFILRMLLLQMLAIVTAASFAFMLSSIFKSSMVSVSLSIVAPIVVSILSSIQSLNKFSTYIFTNHLSPASIIKGDLAMRFTNPNITPSFSIIVLVVWTVVCYAISHVVFTRKDILI